MIKTKITYVNGADGSVIESDWLLKAEPVHRQLRPQIPEKYLEAMKGVFADGGRMAIAVSDGAVLGVAIYRIHRNTALGSHMYVDDLVTDEANRSEGIGRKLLEDLCRVAKQMNCSRVALDSGIQRLEAHKFYKREGFTITSYHFDKEL